VLLTKYYVNQIKRNRMGGEGNAYREKINASRVWGRKPEGKRLLEEMDRTFERNIVYEFNSELEKLL
jgi:hypothetical protein